MEQLQDTEMVSYILDHHVYWNEKQRRHNEMPQMSTYEYHQGLQEVFHVYLNKFENTVTNLFLDIYDNN